MRIIARSVRSRIVWKYRVNLNKDFAYRLPLKRSGGPLAFAEEAGGADDEEADEQDEAVEVFVGGGEEDGAEGFDHAEEDAAGDRAEDGPEAADDDDLEALEGRDRSVLWIDEEVGREQRSGRR